MQVRPHRATITDHLGNVRATVSDMLLPRTGNDLDADLRTLTDYYPFGMTMPGRSYEAAGLDAHRYGYNGKENDNEVKGEGNSLDYGARIYDPRVGRWLSLDPLMSKYPGMSPYNFTANNPVLYVDQDGRDYAVFINHKTKTIVIKATYHIVKGGCDEEMANLGVGLWNAQNGRFTYVVGEGSDAKVYDIKFELTVKPHDDAEKRDAAFVADKTGEGNSLEVRDLKDGHHGTAKSVNGGGINAAVIANTDEAKFRNTPAHELGHTLVGSGHWWKGLMQNADDRSPLDPDALEVTTGNVTKILQHARFGSSAGLQQGDSIKEPGRMTPEVKVRPTGSEPADFVRGSVQEKQSSK